eukprot:6189424-Pleurochrysis_carterae.AAC.3
MPPTSLPQLWVLRSAACLMAIGRGQACAVLLRAATTSTKQGVWSSSHAFNRTLQCGGLLPA